MKERTGYILETAVDEFIRTGDPITSEMLFGCHEYGIKPAMIRRELNALSDEGFLYQRHPSGGRFPTNKAYRFFVEQLLVRELDDTKSAAGLAEDFFSGEKKLFVEELSARLGVFGVIYESAEDRCYESGLKALLQHIEAEERDAFVEVADDIEGLPERISRRRTWWEREEEWPRVFIGESPITRSEQLSVVAGSLGEGREHCLVIAIGPKRMDYKKSLKVMRMLMKCDLK